MCVFLLKGYMSPQSDRRRIQYKVFFCLVVFGKIFSSLKFRQNSGDSRALPPSECGFITGRSSSSGCRIEERNVETVCFYAGSEHQKNILRLPFRWSLAVGADL